jgi:hypothetical protein
MIHDLSTVTITPGAPIRRRVNVSAKVYKIAFMKKLSRSSARNGALQSRRSNQKPAVKMRRCRNYADGKGCSRARTRFGTGMAGFVEGGRALKDWSRCNCQEDLTHEAQPRPKGRQAPVLKSAYKERPSAGTLRAAA